MPIAAAGIVAAGTIGGALIGSNAADKASQAQMAMQQKALDYQKSMAQPYTDFGKSAMGTISNIYGFGAGGASGAGQPGTSPNWDAYMNTPDYQFGLQQGVRALDMSAASKHLLNSGGEARDVTAFGQGFANQQFGSVIQRLMGMVGIGQSAATSSANAVGGTYNNMGNTAAQGIVGQANPWISAMNSGPGNALGAYQYFNGSNNFGGTSASSYAGNSVGGTGLSLSGTGGLF